MHKIGRSTGRQPLVQEVLGEQEPPNSQQRA